MLPWILSQLEYYQRTILIFASLYTGMAKTGIYGLGTLVAPVLAIVFGGKVSAGLFVAMQLPKNVLIGTGAWFFLIINLFKIPFHIFVWNTITLQSFTLNLVMITIILLGWITRNLAGQVHPRKTFQVAVDYYDDICLRKIDYFKLIVNKRILAFKELERVLTESNRNVSVSQAIKQINKMHEEISQFSNGNNQRVLMKNNPIQKIIMQRINTSF